MSDDEAQQGPPTRPWSPDRKKGWNEGYFAGLNDATKITGDALRAAMQNQRERINRTTNRPDVATPVERIAYLLWQVDKGYILAEDRAIGENWFTHPVENLHPDDAEERPGWIDLAETVIAIIKDESDD